jgi:hypothetical protein
MQESCSRGETAATAHWGTTPAKNALCQLLWYIVTVSSRHVPPSWARCFDYESIKYVMLS